MLVSLYIRICLFHLYIHSTNYNQWYSLFAAIFEIGIPITGSPCSFTITPLRNKSDIFISPTYPGTYPKDLFCTYHFIGEKNQRVRLEFRDFDLFFGGPQWVYIHINNQYPSTCCSVYRHTENLFLLSFRSTVAHSIMLKCMTVPIILPSWLEHIAVNKEI